MSNADRFFNRRKVSTQQTRQPAGLAVATAAPSPAVSQQSAHTAVVKPAMTNQDNLMKASLAADLVRIKRIQSHAQRDVRKKDELVPRYREYLKGLIAKNRVGPADVVFCNLVWAIDIGDVEWARALGNYAIEHDVATPDDFRRDIRNVYVGDMARLALKLNQTKTPTPWIVEIEQQSTSWDLVDQIRADLYKACGFETASRQPAKAVDYLTQALALDPRCRVTRVINRLQKRLDAQQVTTHE